MSFTESVAAPTLNTAWPPPSLSCPRLPEFALDDWPQVLAAFRGAATCPMGQGWHRRLDPDWRPCETRVGWHPDALFVLAELHDDDIFNPIHKFNDPAFQHGDVFEMFLRPENQAVYYEFHVSPINQQFQLRIPSAEAFHGLSRAKSAGIEPWYIKETVFQSRAQVLHADHLWRVVARVPFAVVMETEPFQPGCRWKFSFSRYDYTRGRAKPVLSSTSPHLRLGFHRQEEWGTLTFV